MGTIGRRVRAALLTAVVAATTAVGAGGGAVPASAQAPEHTVTVTPSTGLREGDTVEVTTTGLSTTDIFGVLQCDASALGNLPSAFSGPCLIKSIRLGGAEVDTVAIPVSGSFRARTATSCAAATSPRTARSSRGRPTAGRRAPSSTWSPRRSRCSSPAQEAGYPVEAILTGPDGIGATAQLAQCRLPVGPDLASSECSPAPARRPSTPAATPSCRSPWWPRSATRPTRAARTTAPPPCSTTPAPSLGSAPVIVQPDDGPPRMSLPYGLEDAADGGYVTVTSTAIRNEAFDVAQSAASVTATHDVAGGPCTAAFHARGTARPGLRLRRPPAPAPSSPARTAPKSPASTTTTACWRSPAARAPSPPCRSRGTCPTP